LSTKEPASASEWAGELLESIVVGSLENYIEKAVEDGIPKQLLELTITGTIAAALGGAAGSAVAVAADTLLKNVLGGRLTGKLNELQQRMHQVEKRVEFLFVEPMLTGRRVLSRVLSTPPSDNRVLQADLVVALSSFERARTCADHFPNDHEVHFSISLHEGLTRVFLDGHRQHAIQRLNYCREFLDARANEILKAAQEGLRLAQSRVASKRMRCDELLREVWEVSGRSPVRRRLRILRGEPSEFSDATPEDNRYFEVYDDDSPEQALDHANEALPRAEKQVASINEFKEAISAFLTQLETAREPVVGP
jgi:hypothetical protein